MAGNTRMQNLPTIMTFIMNVTTAGTPEQLGVKLSAATIAFNDNSGSGTNDTITDSGNLLIINGFQKGDRVTVTGSTSNDGIYEIQSVVAGTLTLTKSGTLTTEAAGATVKLFANKVIPSGIMLNIKAKNGNTNLIYFSNSSARANKNNGQAFTLRNNEETEIQITETKQIWIDADTSTEGVEVQFEQDNRDL